MTDSDSSVGEATYESIARDQMEYLKKNRDICAAICIAAGNHCKIRYHAGEWEYLTTGRWRTKHFHRVSEQTVFRLFVENTPRIEPVSESKWTKHRDQTAWESHGRIANV